MLKFIPEFFCIGKMDLVRNLVSRNMKLKFRRSYLGFFWSLLVPIAMAFTYMILFSYIMRVQVPHYLPFIVFNVMSWSFFSVACLEGLETVIANYGILIKVPISINIFNFSSALTHGFYFVTSLPAIFFFLFLDGLRPNIMYTVLPFLILIFFLITYFISVILAVVYVHLRDIKHVFSVGLQLWMYATPVLYPVSMLPSNFNFLIYLNPLAALYISFHDILFHSRWPQLNYILVSLGWLFGLFCLSAYVYHSFRKNLLELV
jgi:ABC-type polysaccharide/polyol phosphate export permease